MITWLARLLVGAVFSYSVGAGSGAAVAADAAVIGWGISTLDPSLDASVISGVFCWLRRRRSHRGQGDALQHLIPAEVLEYPPPPIPKLDVDCVLPKATHTLGSPKGLRAAAAAAAAVQSLAVGRTFRKQERSPLSTEGLSVSL